MSKEYNTKNISDSINILLFVLQMGRPIKKQDLRDQIKNLNFPTLHMKTKSDEASNLGKKVYLAI